MGQCPLLGVTLLPEVDTLDYSGGKADLTKTLGQEFEQQTSVDIR